MKMSREACKPGVTKQSEIKIWLAAIGCTAGIVPHLLATILGLTAVMHTSAVAFQALKLAGVANLLYLAIVTWKDKTAFAIASTPSTNSAVSLMVKAAVIESPRVQAWLRHSFAAAFAGLGANLALSER